MTVLHHIDQQNLEHIYDQTLLESYVDQVNVSSYDLIEEKEDVLNESLIASLGSFATGWLAWMGHLLMVGGAVLTLAKVIAMGMKFGAKRLDKNIEAKQKVIDTIVDEIYSEHQGKIIKDITKKIQSGQELTDEEMTSLKDAHEKINKEIRQKLEEQYKQGKKQNIARALYMASSAIESKMGLVSAFLGGAWVFASMSSKPEFQGELPRIDYDKGEKALADYSRKNTELRNKVGVSPFPGIL